MLELAKAKPGDTVLILGGTGGVGSHAIQLAKLAGIHVIATARKSQVEAVRQLGAERVIDYASEPLEDAKPVNAVLNLVGGETVARSYALVKPGGVAVTANQPPDAEEAARRGIQAAFVQTDVQSKGLNTIASQILEGKVKPQIAAVETLWSPATLWEKRKTDSIGKVVFSIRS